MDQMQDTEISLVVNALHVAAEVYRRDAADARRTAALPGVTEEEGQGFERLARQFDMQSSQAQFTADRFECAEGVYWTEDPGEPI